VGWRLHWLNALQSEAGWIAVAVVLCAAYVACIARLASLPMQHDGARAVRQIEGGDMGEIALLTARRSHAQHRVRRYVAAQKAVEEKQQIVVGVNEFAVSGEPPFETLRLDPELESRQVERLKAFRRRRDESAATRALSDVKRAAEGTENVVPRIVAAVKARSTLGEIANAMREVFGEHGR